MTLAKADLDIAERYVRTLAPEHTHGIFDVVREEFDLTVAQVLAVTGDEALLDREPVLVTTLEVRENYLEPLHLLQVQLLDRRRKGEDDPRPRARPPAHHQRHRRGDAQHRLTPVVEPVETR